MAVKQSIDSRAVSAVTPMAGPELVVNVVSIHFCSLRHYAISVLRLRSLCSCLYCMPRRPLRDVIFRKYKSYIGPSCRAV